MQYSVLDIPRAVRRRLKRLAQESTEHGRRAHAVLALWETANHVSEVARRLYAARSSVQRWRALYEEFGEQGLEPLERGRSEWKASERVFPVLVGLVDSSPQDHGYLRSRWSSELLAKELARKTNVEVHATIIRRWLERLEFGYRRARPTLCIRDPNKSPRMRAVKAALADESAHTLNPMMHANATPSSLSQPTPLGSWAKPVAANQDL